MDINEQISAVRIVYKKLMDPIYEKEFIMRTASVMGSEIEWYSWAISIVEAISSLIETALASGNPKRALKYCVMLDNSIRLFIKRTDDDYHMLIDKRLIGNC